MFCTDDFVQTVNVYFEMIECLGCKLFVFSKFVTENGWRKVGMIVLDQGTN